MRDQRGNSRNRYKSLEAARVWKGALSTRWRKGGCSITGLPGLRQVQDLRPSVVTWPLVCAQETGTPLSCPLSALVGTWAEGAMCWWEQPRLLLS